MSVSIESHMDIITLANNSVISLSSAERGFIWLAVLTGWSIRFLRAMDTLRIWSVCKADRMD
jgi:hypothetical protein